MKNLILATFYAVCLTAGLGISIPALVYAGAAIYTKSTTDTCYPYEGFTPDCPRHEEGGLW